MIPSRAVRDAGEDDEGEHLVRGILEPVELADEDFEGTRVASDICNVKVFAAFSSPDGLRIVTVKDRRSIATRHSSEQYSKEKVILYSSDVFVTLSMRPSW